MEGRSAPKIPTVIAYDKADPTKYKWGVPATESPDAIVAIKLLLDPDQRRPLHLPFYNIKTVMRSLPKPPVVVASDFIGAIYQYALEKISNTVPSRYMDLCRKEFILSGMSKYRSERASTFC